MIAANSGPNITTGNTNPVQNTEPDQGPSLTFQGGGLLDPRFVSQIGGPPGTKIYGLYSNSYVVSTDAVPVTAGAARIAAASAPAAAVAIPLVAAQAAGVAPLIPVLPFGLAPISTNLVQALALDFGFTVGSVVSASKTLTIPAGAWRYFALNTVLAGAAAQKQFRIIGFGLAPDNAIGDAFTVVRVTLAQSQLRAATTAV